MSEVRIGRAAFLSIVGAGVAGIVAGNRVAGALSTGPTGALGGLLPDGLGGLLPTDGWRIYAIDPPWPTFRPRSYRLAVDGLVERPLRLTWPEVAALPSERQTSDFHCVTGWSVGGVHWAGVRPHTLLALARPRPEARYVRFHSLERPYVDTLSLDQFRLPGVMLAHTMDGRPLLREHGAPLRLVIPQMYGYKNVKWLARIEFVRDLVPGFWEQNGYDVDAWVGRSNGY
jgi:DMSO/TMAO reductase YedYZ molybdopterin-dependent catalytic subunit